MATSCPTCVIDRSTRERIPEGQFPCENCGSLFCGKHINAGRCRSCRERINSFVARAEAKTGDGKDRIKVKQVFKE
jgi:hypothetical protein